MDISWNHNIVLVCSCGGYFSTEYEFEGKLYGLCKTCWKEELLNASDAADAADATDAADVPDAPQKKDFISLVTKEVPVTKELLEKNELTPGDHIMWRRPYVVCHHAIVENTERLGDDKLKVVHWAPTDSPNALTIQISSKEINFKSERGEMYKIEYEKDIEIKNPAHLVLKRAKALDGLRDYHFFRKNCENFARFCKTGVNFNLQYPWLKRKLDQTATSTLFKAMTAIMFADLVDFQWSFRHHLMGSCVIVALELISLVTDMSNAYFQYKYPTSYLRPLKDYQESVIMRIFEFVFGSAGTILGFIFSEKLCIYIGDRICPGMGTWVGFALGTLVFGIIGGFALGVGGKALGNAIGIRIGKFDFCTGKKPSSNDTSMDLAETKERPLNNDTSVDRVEANLAKMKKKKMVRRYLARCWKAQLGMILIIFSCVLFFAFTKQYVKIYRDFRSSIKAECVTKNIAYLREIYPCPAIQVVVLDSQSASASSRIDQSGNRNNRMGGTPGGTTQLFENERTFKYGSCSYQPRCRENDTKTAIEMDDYLQKYGNLGGNFTCYYHPKNHSMVIRKLASRAFFVHAFFWPVLVICFGVGLIVYAMIRKRNKWADAIAKNQNHNEEKVETWFITFLSVLGLTSYLYVLRWFRYFARGSDL